MDSYHTYGMNCSCCQRFGPGDDDYGRQPSPLTDIIIPTYDFVMSFTDRPKLYDWEMY
jgi:hypothetical protein